MKKPKRRTSAQVKAEKKRAARKSYIRKNKGFKKVKTMEAQKRFRIEVEKQVQKMMKEKQALAEASSNSATGSAIDNEDWVKDIKIGDADNKRK